MSGIEQVEAAIFGLILLLAASSANIIHEENPDIGHFWQLTDIHYDANYSTKGSPDQMCHSNQAADIKMSGRYGNPLCDSPLILVSSALQAMKEEFPIPDFILWTGDNIAHLEDAEYNSAKTYLVIRNVTEMIQKTFLGVQLMPSIGNHDSWPKNTVPPSVRAITSGEVDYYYYKHLMDSAGWNVKNTILERDNIATFAKGGYYSQHVAPFLKILNLNTILWFRWNPQAQDKGDPAQQFEWMEKELTLARKYKMKVIVAGHISPGCIAGIEEAISFYPAHNQRFLQILSHFQDVITACIFGHDHTDSFHLWYSKAGVPQIPFYIGPAITPQYDRNPAIRLYRYQKTTGQVLDYVQYYLNLTAANQNRAVWRHHYTATEEYGLTDLSPASLDGLVRRMQPPGSQEFDIYLHNNDVLFSGKQTCNSSCKQQHMCAIMFVDIDIYTRCLNHVDIVFLLNHQSDNRGKITAVVVVVALALLLLISLLAVLVFWHRKKIFGPLLAERRKPEANYTLLNESDTV